MKLRAKLFTAFIAVIILPIALISCATGVLIKYQLSSIQQSYNIESDSIGVIQNPLRILNKVTSDLFDEISDVAKSNPVKLSDQEYINKINEALQAKYSFLILRKKNHISYVGDTVKAEEVLPRLPSYGEFDAKIDGGIYMSGIHSYLVKQKDYQDLYGNNCSIFIVTDVNTLVPEIKGFVIQIVIAFLIIICFTGTIITWWLYRALIKPLTTLRIATNRMKEGDLTYSIDISTRDEIGVLCDDFEEMRLRLKELIETKLLYEQNSKEMISNISHDLKTPLTTIKGYTEGILDGVADTPEKMDKYLRTIYTKANDMTLLVDELSLFTKLDYDNIPYKFTSILLEQYFNDCIQEIVFDLEMRNIDIGYFNYADPSTMIYVDPEQLKKVINNIIGNSTKYMDKKKGIINIRINDIGKFVQVEIEDNGKGINKKDIPYIFDRFYRADASRNSSTGGSGLGLAIVKKIVEDHGGSIWAKSKEGMGSIIYFTIKKEGSVNE